MPRELQLERDGVGLAAVEFGGVGLPVLLLHGLAGYGGEWSGAAAGLVDCARVVAFDARGHGASERFPRDVSREAHVADELQVMAALGVDSFVVVGQSLGGVTALLSAAEHPEQVRGLVIVEASPDSGKDDGWRQVERSLRSWPVPFSTRQEAVRYFAGRGFAADVWADGLEQRADGLWPRFDTDVVVRTLREADSRAYWDEWERISCPILVVRGAAGSMPVGHARELVRRARRAELVELDGAGHDLHLEQPEPFQACVREFIRSIG